MKKIFLTTSTLACLAASSQCVEVQRFTTVGLHYLTNQNVKGFQFELGSSGSESNISYYATVTGYGRKTLAKDTVTAYPGMAIGMKLAYRIIRVENVFQLLVGSMAALDIQEGFYNATSIKVITILGGKVALSIEPAYLPIQKAFVGQAGVNIIID